jgi:branched-chain amino acid transport system ATP-binding protein
MLEINNLEVVYHDVVLVLRGISIAVPGGGIVALLGPNGAGKTTLLRAVTGLLSVHDGKITKGSIRFGDRDLVGLPPERIVKNGIAQVLEGRRIFADLTVEENLLTGGAARRDREVKADADRLLARFPAIGERRRQLAGYLSGGEQQMLAIGRALMARPKLLLLDEPSLGLAPKVVAEVARLVREIQSEGVGILLVEQNAAMALDLAQTGYVMENGKIVHDGPCEELRQDKDIQEFYLGFGEHGRASYREVKLYRRRKRWLS